jgi:hypothetical protein
MLMMGVTGHRWASTFADIVVSPAALSRQTVDPVGVKQVILPA